MNWEIVLQALGVVVAAILGTSQVLARLPKSRTTLKHDLEVLKLLDRSHPQRGLIDMHVRKSIERIYQAERSHQGAVRRSFIVHQWGDFLGGTVVLFGGALWLLYVVRDGFSWWALLPAFLVLGGLGGILEGLEDKKLANKPLQPPSGADK
jgi:hypothetical protein